MPVTADDPLPPYTVCQTGNYLGWMDLLYCIEPVTCVYIGIALALGLSILGAAWGILITGSSIMGTNIKMPFVQSKNLISVILCEATAIYGVIIALLLAIEVGGKNIDVYQSLDVYQAAEYAGYCYLIIGLVVGVSNLACGLCVGVLGSSTVLLHAQTPTGFVSMLVVMIFGSVFGLFGLIIGIIFQTNARWPTQ